MSLLRPCQPSCAKANLPLAMPTACSCAMLLTVSLQRSADTPAARRARLVYANAWYANDCLSTPAVLSRAVRARSAERRFPLIVLLRDDAGAEDALSSDLPLAERARRRASCRSVTALRVPLRSAPAPEPELFFFPLPPPFLVA